MQPDAAQLDLFAAPPAPIVMAAPPPPPARPVTPGVPKPPCPPSVVAATRAGLEEEAERLRLAAFVGIAKVRGLKARVEGRDAADVRRFANEVLRGVASDRPALTPDRWHAATAALLPYAEALRSGSPWAPPERVQEAPNAV